MMCVELVGGLCGGIFPFVPTLIRGVKGAIILGIRCTIDSAKVRLLVLCVSLYLFNCRTVVTRIIC